MLGADRLFRLVLCLSLFFCRAKLSHLEELDAWTVGQASAFDNGAMQNITARATLLADAAHLPPVPPLKPATPVAPMPPQLTGPPRPQVF